jgi:hypothetical protein
MNDFKLSSVGSKSYLNTLTNNSNPSNTK